MTEETRPALAPDAEFWRLKTVVGKTGLSKSEIYRRVAASNFPEPRKYADKAKATFWVSTDVMAWMQAQLVPDEFESMLG